MAHSQGTGLAFPATIPFIDRTSTALAEDRTFERQRHHAPHHLQCAYHCIWYDVASTHEEVQYSADLSAGTNSPITMIIIVGVFSQVWLRRYHPGWYKKYNYILGGALDGGAQVMIFILSFAVFGASGAAKPFPTWAGNPAVGNVDYCNGNGALD